MISRFVVCDIHGRLSDDKSMLEEALTWANEKVPNIDCVVWEKQYEGQLLKANLVNIRIANVLIAGNWIK